MMACQHGLLPPVRVVKMLCKHISDNQMHSTSFQNILLAFWICKVERGLGENYISVKKVNERKD